MAVDTVDNYLTFNGTNWTTPTPISGAGGGLAQVSCYNSSFCGTFDNNGDAFIYKSGAWSAATSLAGANGLRGISCTSSSTCLAVGGSGAC